MFSIQTRKASADQSEFGQHCCARVAHRTEGDSLPGETPPARRVQPPLLRPGLRSFPTIDSRIKPAVDDNQH